MTKQTDFDPNILQLFRKKQGKKPKTGPYDGKTPIDMIKQGDFNPDILTETQQQSHRCVTIPHLTPLLNLTFEGSATRLSTLFFGIIGIGVRRFGVRLKILTRK